MQIIIYNQKGGVGKSMLATQLALHYDTSIIELDPYGMLSDTLGEEIVYKVNLDENVPKIEEGDVIYDFGGFDDIRLDEISINANLIIIPFNPTINSLGTTLKSYNRIKNLNLPVLFVANAVLNEKDVNESIEFLKENTNDAIDFYTIPRDRGEPIAQHPRRGTALVFSESGFFGQCGRRFHPGSGPIEWVFLTHLSPA